MLFVVRSLFFGGYEVDDLAVRVVWFIGWLSGFGAWAFGSSGLCFLGLHGYEAICFRD